MKMALIILLFVSSLFAGSALVNPAKQTKAAPQDKTSPFMRAKLVGSQHVLEGLVTEDFQRIRMGAENMKKMSQAAQWPRSEDKVYEHFGAEFRRQCDKLVKLADNKNLEGAHYTHLHMTTTCINCHDYVRGYFRVERDKNNPQGPVRLIPTQWDRKKFRPNRSANTGQHDETQRKK